MCFFSLADKIDDDACKFAVSQINLPASQSRQKPLNFVHDAAIMLRGVGGCEGVHQPGGPLWILK
jgi:hypothetical protein